MRHTMQMPKRGPIGRCLDEIRVQYHYPHYRRLMIRSLVLRLRMESLSMLVAVVLPFATPGLVMVLRRWFDQLRADVREFGRTVRTQHAQIATPAARHNEFRNPWV